MNHTMSAKTVTNFIDPRISAQFVVNLAKNVTIRKDGIKNMAHMLNNDMKLNKYNISLWKEHVLHPKVADEKAIDWIFVIDCLNFSFWPNLNQEYTIDGYNGYWALCAAINRATDNHIPITDARFYANISEEQMKNIFRTDSGVEVPLLTERLQILRESAKVLIEKFDGSFVNCVKRSNSNALNLLKMIVNNFASFRDQAIYRGREVSFYKRAQILIADIWGCFEGKGLGFFEDIDHLTMFADYRVPQVLAYFNAIEYSEELKTLLKNNHLFKNGDEMEIELRAASIQAIEMIKEEIKTIDNSQAINSVLIDYYLWDYRRKNSEEIEAKVGFHRVRSIYY